jgi:hypothetical protein
MRPTHPYIEAHEGFFSTSYSLCSPAGEELARYDHREDAEDALRELLRKREGGGLLSWLF